RGQPRYAPWPEPGPLGNRRNGRVFVRCVPFGGIPSASARGQIPRVYPRESRRARKEASEPRPERADQTGRGPQSSVGCLTLIREPVSFFSISELLYRAHKPRFCEHSGQWVSCTFVVGLGVPRRE